MAIPADRFRGRISEAVNPIQQDKKNDRTTINHGE
jgi:hypothetical protein